MNSQLFEIPSGRERRRGAHCGEEGHGQCRHHRGKGEGRDFDGRGPGYGFGRRGGGGSGRGFAESRNRIFDAGDIRFVILKLLAEQPSHGYQLIKNMEQRLSGGYAPSPGVIYPTLTLLEEEGLAKAAIDDSKKVYSLTAEGLVYVEANKQRIDELFSRLDEAGRTFERGRSPEIMKAFMNLRGAVIARISRQSIKPEQIQQIVEAINAATHSIDEL